MADQEQLAAFAYHWRAAGLAETTLRYYLSWLGRLDVDDATTDDWLAAQLADMTPSQRHYALPAARAWGRWRGTGLGRTLKTPKVRCGLHELDGRCQRRDLEPLFVGFMRSGRLSALIRG